MKTIILFFNLSILLFFFLFISPGKISALVFYNTTPPSGANYNVVSTDQAPTLCGEPLECANSHNPGNCGLPVCTGGGNDWTKYALTCVKYVDPDTYEATYDSYYQQGGAICSIGDKCVGSETGLRAGGCDCGYSASVYKYCCTSGGEAEFCSTAAVQDNNYPSEGLCPGGSVVEGSGGRVSYNSCVPIAVPVPTDVPAPTPVQSVCTAYSQGPVCDTSWCSGGAVCAQGHQYCLFDGSGYGGCSEEVNNCASQCTGPTATPIPPTSTPGILPAPTGLVGLCPSPGNLASLSWNNVTNATGYSVRTSNSSGQILPSPYSKDGLTANSYSFTSTSGSSYSFVVYAEKSGTWSAASAAKNFTCVVPTPVPVTIRITDARCTLSGSNASSSVYWTGTGPIDHYYYTYRAQPDAWLSQILTSSTNLTFASTAGKTYDIQVSACNAANACVQTTSTFSCPVLGQAPTPSITKPACLNAPLPASSSQITISWVNNATPVTFVDISNDNFVTYFKKTVPAGSSSITAPVGFDGLFLDSNGSRINTQTLPIALNQNYSVRTFTNASAPNYGHSTVVSFLIPPCPTPTIAAPIPGSPTATPTPGGAPIPTVAGAPLAPTNLSGICTSPPGTSATLYWEISAGATSYIATVNGANSTCTQVIPTLPARIVQCTSQPTIIGTNSFYVKACNGSSNCSNQSSTATFTCDNTILPWIFVDGDVHSNTGIHMR